MKCCAKHLATIKKRIRNPKGKCLLNKCKAVIEQMGKRAARTSSSYILDDDVVFSKSQPANYSLTVI